MDTLQSPAPPSSELAARQERRRIEPWLGFRTQWGINGVWLATRWVGRPTVRCINDGWLATRWVGRPTVRCINDVWLATRWVGRPTVRCIICTWCIEARISLPKQWGNKGVLTRRRASGLSHGGAAVA